MTVEYSYNEDYCNYDVIYNGFRIGRYELIPNYFPSGNYRLSFENDKDFGFMSDNTVTEDEFKAFIDEFCYHYSSCYHMLYRYNPLYSLIENNNIPHTLLSYPTSSYGGETGRVMFITDLASNRIVEKLRRWA